MTQYLKLFGQIVDKNDINGLPMPGLTGGEGGTVSKALQLVFAIAGAISVLIVTIGAFQYVISQGDSQSTARAKNTIMYAVVGLVICLTAFAIITFVINRI